VRVPIRKNLKLGRAAGVPSPARGGRHDSDVREEGGCRGIFRIARIAAVPALRL